MVTVLRAPSSVITPNLYSPGARSRGGTALITPSTPTVTHSGASSAARMPVLVDGTLDGAASTSSPARTVIGCHAKPSATDTEISRCSSNNLSSSVMTSTTTS